MSKIPYFSLRYVIEKVSKSAETPEIVETKHERRSTENEKVEKKSEKSPKKVSKRKLKSAIIATSNEDSAKTGESANSEKKEQINSKSKKRSLANDDETYSSKKRSVFDSSESDSKKASNSEGIDSKMSVPIDMDDASKENETKFLVTLDGVKDMFKGSISIGKSASCAFLK